MTSLDSSQKYLAIKASFVLWRLQHLSYSVAASIILQRTMFMLGVEQNSNIFT